MSSNAGSTNEKKIKLSKYTAQALQATTQRVNQLAASARAAQTEFESSLGIHQQHLFALIQDAGHKIEDFEQYRVREEDGETYLYPAPKQQ